MRLLNTHTRTLEEYFTRPIPPFSILSHRWGEDEVSYKEYKRGLHKDGLGFDKIVEACKFARGRGQQYLWIDTCCIDKRSSAELSEAINSMFAWYENATECYVYLSDVRPLAGNDPETVMGDIWHSQWFTRGWTLQELIAPGVLIFCAKDWAVLGEGHKGDNTWENPVWKFVHERTGIPFTVLASGMFLDLAHCAAQKLCWAAHRQTTRVEDEAYCLLGLFGINMALIYGEKDKAFRRLLKKVLRAFNDESILAWAGERNVWPHGPLAALLPAGPLLYKLSSHVRTTYANAYHVRFTLENGGNLVFRDPESLRETFRLNSDSVPETYMITLQSYGCIGNQLGQRCADYYNENNKKAMPPTRIIVERLSCGHFARRCTTEYHDDYCPGPVKEPKWTRVTAPTLYLHAFSMEQCIVNR